MILLRMLCCCLFCFVFVFFLFVIVLCFSFLFALVVHLLTHENIVTNKLIFILIAWMPTHYCWRLRQWDANWCTRDFPYGRPVLCLVWVCIFPSGQECLSYSQCAAVDGALFLFCVLGLLLFLVCCMLYLFGCFSLSFLCILRILQIHTHAQTQAQYEIGNFTAAFAILLDLYAGRKLPYDGVAAAVPASTATTTTATITGGGGGGGKPAAAAGTVYYLSLCLFLCCCMLLFCIWMYVYLWLTLCHCLSMTRQRKRQQQPNPQPQSQPQQRL